MTRKRGVDVRRYRCVEDVPGEWWVEGQSLDRLGDWVLILDEPFKSKAEGLLYIDDVQRRQEAMQREEQEKGNGE